MNKNFISILLHFLQRILVKPDSQKIEASNSISFTIILLNYSRSGLKSEIDDSKRFSHEFSGEGLWALN